MCLEIDCICGQSHVRGYHSESEGVLRAKTIRDSVGQSTSRLNDASDTSSEPDHPQRCRRLQERVQVVRLIGLFILR